MFLGRDGFVWWIGVVEDIDDPLLLGRSKVRIFGYHPEYSSSKVPTEDLPWAITIMPTNIPEGYGTSNLGDWVFGFFLDAKEAQEPAIVGYIPAVPSGGQNFSRYSSTTRSFPQVTTSNQPTFTDTSPYSRLSDAQKNAYQLRKERWSIRTRAGHLVEFVDNSNNETITIKHKIGTEIKIDKFGNLTIQANNVTVNATSTLNLTSGGNMNLTARGDMNITSSRNVRVRGSRIDFN